MKKNNSSSKNSKLLKNILNVVFWIVIGIIVYFAQPYLKQVGNEIKTIENGLLKNKKSAKEAKKNFEETKNNKDNTVQNYTPKGNRSEFCSINVYQNNLPFVSNGFKTSKNVKGIDENSLNLLCYSGFTAMFKPDYNISLYVAEKLSIERENKAKGGERESSFYQDPVILNRYGNAVKTEDYIGSGFDRGHLGASRNMPLEDRYESFYMTNIVPQTPENNRNVWAEIEKEARCMATRYKSDVYTVTIPVIDIQKHKGSGKLPVLKTKRKLDIVVPDYMAKAIYIPSKKIQGVFLTRNDKSKTDFKFISLKELEQLAYIQPFPFLTENEKNTTNISVGNCGNKPKTLNEVKQL